MRQCVGSDLYRTLDPNFAIFLLINLCQLWCGRFTLNRLVPIGGVRVDEKGGTVRFYELECFWQCVKAELILNEAQLYCTVSDGDE